VSQQAVVFVFENCMQSKIGQAWPIHTAGRVPSDA